MTGARDITQLCFSSNFTGIVANIIEQSFYSVHLYPGTESIEHALKYSLSHPWFYLEIKVWKLLSANSLKVKRL